jgi:hypothetical protein
VPSDAVSSARSKPVRDMTDSERQEFWDRLPQADKDRIIAKRQQIEQEAAQQERWKTPSAGTPRSMVPDSQPVAPDATANPELQRSLDNGKAQWDAMTPEEKRAFVEAHKAEIMNAIETRQNGQ